MFKNVARKPVSRKEIYLKYGFVITEYEKHLCPRCKSVLSAGPNYQPKYCDQCGQKINFSSVIWKKEKTLGYAERRDICEQVQN